MKRLATILISAAALGACGGEAVVDEGSAEGPVEVKGSCYPVGSERAPEAPADFPEAEQVCVADDAVGDETANTRQMSGCAPSVWSEYHYWWGSCGSCGAYLKRYNVYRRICYRLTDCRVICGNWNQIKTGCVVC